MQYTEEQKAEARKLYIQGNKAPEISKSLGIGLRTLYSWVKKEDWGQVIDGEDTTYRIRRRINLLLERENKTALELKELNDLVRHLERLELMKAKIRNMDRRADEGGAASGSSSKRGRKKAKNDFSNIDEKELMEKFKEGLFDYQWYCWEHRKERTRNILKSRQIGMTWYFAREAFADALLSGDNQVFLSASRAQSDIFREYIRLFAMEWFGIELTGKDKIELITPHGVATLYFLSTNSATAQGYHGHVYVDEYFWIPNFKKLKKVATAMGSQKKWRKTYFSTPSAKSHEAYPMWSGDEFNERRKTKNQAIIEFPDTETLRKKGVRCADHQWRRVITLEDAEKGGCDLFDIEELKIEYSEDEFQQLFMCKFIDDTGSVFKFSQLEKCLDDISEYKDFKPDQPRPFGNRPVWIGYDPSRVRDGACIVVLAAPNKINGKFRVLEKITMHNIAWQHQAEVIRELTEKYNVEYIGIDTTGPGSGVHEMVQRFYPAAEGIYYTTEKKTKLVLKAQQVIGDDRLRWDGAWSDIAAGFMQIQRGTSGGQQIIYFANRSDTTGHADAAWAIMHALIHEDLVPHNEDDVKIAFSAA